MWRLLLLLLQIKQLKLFATHPYFCGAPDDTSAQEHSQIIGDAIASLKIKKSPSAATDPLV
jgi:hypothetical protein